VVAAVLAVGVAAAEDLGTIAGINALADASACVKVNWKDRGTMPKAYLRGLAYSFAKAVCNPTRQDVAFFGNIQLGTNDALALYGPTLKAKLGPTSTGITTARQLYTLLTGLGMRESSGKYCVGRDMSAKFSAADSAEAGLFQTSWGAHRRASLLTDLYTKYQGNKAGCGIPSYTTSVSCKAGDLRNWGKESEDGFKWQKLTKDCPSFATEYAAVLLRLNGGAKGEWGPLRRMQVEVHKVCYDFFGAIQNYVVAKPAVCTALHL